MYFKQSNPDFSVVLGLAGANPLSNFPFYGLASLPAADTIIPYENIFTELRLNYFSQSLIISPRHVVQDLEGNILSVSFKKHRHHKHGGVTYLGGEKYKFRHLNNEDITEEPLSFENNTVYIADTEYPGVYGHDLMETVTQMWALRYIDKCKIYTSSPIKCLHIKKLISALGVDLELVNHLDKKTIFTGGVIIPDPAVKLRKYIHPVAFDVFEKIKSSLIIPGDYPKKIYISRSKVKGRSLINEHEVESFFKSKGFVIIHPQELDISKQISIFASAEQIVGAAGSAMHNAVFCSDKAKILMLSSPSWFVVADLLIDNGMGRIGYVFGDSSLKDARGMSDWVLSINILQKAVNDFFGT